MFSTNNFIDMEIKQNFCSFLYTLYSIIFNFTCIAEVKFSIGPVHTKNKFDLKIVHILDIRLVFRGGGGGRGHFLTFFMPKTKIDFLQYPSKYLVK